MTDSISDETRESIINDLDNDAGSQAEIADEHDVSQSTVSNIKTAYQNGRETGYRDGIKETYSFEQEDETEESEGDDWTCGYCENSGEGVVHVEYLASECPNGHDLSGDWD